MRKKLPPGRRAVHQRRLDDALRHALQRGDEDDHEEAGVLPDVHDDDRRHRVVAVGQPVHRGQADQPQVVVDDAEVVGEEIAPDDRDEGGGDDDRQEEGQPEEVEQPARHRAVERQRQQQADRRR